jgi:hypothetical protein
MRPVTQDLWQNNHELHQVAGRCGIFNLGILLVFQVFHGKTATRAALLTRLPADLEDRRIGEEMLAH